MPKKGGKKRSAKGKKHKTSAAEKEKVIEKAKHFLRTYAANCEHADTSASTKITAMMRDCVETGKACPKLVLQKTEVPAAPIKPKEKPKSADPGSSSSSGTANPVVQPTAPPAQITLQPLFKSLKDAHYTYIRCLDIWGLELDDDAVVSLALFLENDGAENLKVLEMRDTHLTPWSTMRLSKALEKVQLTTLNMDYNELRRDTLQILCDKLQRSVTLQSLSLNFCKLDRTCGEPLGNFVSASQIRNLSLIGNNLQCEGCNEFFRPLVSLTEMSVCTALGDIIDVDIEKAPSDDELLKLASDKAEASSHAATPKPLAPTLGESARVPLPPLAKLDLKNNSIDAHGISVDEPIGRAGQTFEPVICTRAIKRWITSSPVVEELNLDQNQIGDGAARELLQGLELRKVNGLPDMKLIVTAHLLPEIFEKISALTVGGKKKKGKGKKGKKKK